MRDNEKIILSELGSLRIQRAPAAYYTYIQDRFSNVNIDVEALVIDLAVIINLLERGMKREE